MCLETKVKLIICWIIKYNVCIAERNSEDQDFHLPYIAGRRTSTSSLSGKCVCVAYWIIFIYIYYWAAISTSSLVENVSKTMCVYNHVVMSVLIDGISWNWWEISQSIVKKLPVTILDISDMYVYTSYFSSDLVRALAEARTITTHDDNLEKQYKES